jgi:hypothetical protein
MASISESLAHTEAEAARAAIIAAANAQFIVQADQKILDEIARGNFFASFTIYDQVDTHAIFLYYFNLGYQVSFPDFVQNGMSNQTNQLLGAFWTQFWIQVGLNPDDIKKPIRMMIAWNP